MRLALSALALTLGTATVAGAQNRPAAPAGPPALEVGAVAPDFALPGATRYGVLQQPLRLSDFKGKAVVLAFYFRARTRG
jgi:thioredoxin-dependent peroxiredoxin